MRWEDRTRNTLLISLIAITCFVSFPFNLQATEEGSALFTLEYQSRSFKNRSSGGTFNTDSWELSLRADALQKTIMYGTVVGSQTSAVGDDGTRFGRTFIGIGDLSLNPRFLIDAVLGDTSFRYTALVAPKTEQSILFDGAMPSSHPGNPFQSFRNFTYPNIYIRGVQSYILFREGSVSLISGRVQRQEGLTGDLIRGTGSNLAGAKGRVRVNERLDIGSGFVYVLNETPLFETTKVNNSVFLVEGQFHQSRELTYLLHSEISGHGHISDTPSSGLLLRLGPVYQSEKLKLEGNYRRNEPGFLFIDPAQQLERDREGVYAVGEYAYSPSTQFFSSLDFNRTNLSHDLTKPRINTLNTILGTTLLLPYSIGMTTSLGVSRISGDDGTGESISGGTYRFRMNGSYRRGLWAPYWRYRWEHLNDSRSSNNTLNEMIGGLSGSPLRSVYFRSELGARFESDDSAILIEDQVNYYPAWIGLSVSAGLDLEFHNPDDPSGTQAVRRLSGGFYWSLPYRSRLFLQIIDSRTRSNFSSQNSFQIQFKLTSQLRWGIHRPTYAGMPGQPYGVVHGAVFNDLNMNGEWDYGEPGIPDIHIKIDKRTVAVTDSKGRYVIPKVGVGEHRIDLDVRRLPADFIILSPTPAKLEIHSGDVVQSDFTVVLGSSIQGRVYDKETGEGIPNITLYLKPGNAFTYTNTSGEFLIENLAPGDYDLYIDSRTLPQGNVMIEPEFIKIGLVAGGEAHEVEFGIRITPRPIQKEIE
jgi:hypothetical protein